MRNTIVKEIHLRCATRIGHRLAFSSPEQERMGLRQHEGVCHGNSIFRVRVTAHNESRTEARVHQLDQAVCRVAQIHHTTNIEQLFQCRTQNFSGYQVQTSMGLLCVGEGFVPQSF